MQDFFSEYILEELKEAGVDINDENFIFSDKYQKFKSMYILMPIEIDATVDYYVEKYILSQEQVNTMKSGLFDINTKRELSKEELKISRLYKELSDEEDKRNELDESKNQHSTNIDFEQKIKGANSGIQTKLKKKVGFDLEDFALEKYEQLKILKLLYNFEKVEKLNITKMLENPSLENVSNRIIGVESTNGDITERLKNEVMKELTPDFIGLAKQVIVDIVKEWEVEMQNITSLFLIEKSSKSENGLEKIKLSLDDILELIPDKQSITYKHSLFESFYLLILTHENISRQLDLLKIHEYIDRKFIGGDFQKNRFAFNYEQLISISEVSDFIMENTDELCRCILGKNHISSDDRKILMNRVQYLDRLIEITRNNSKTRFTNGIDVLWIIAALQEIHQAMLDSESFSHKFYRHKTNSGSLMSRLNPASKKEEIYELLWTKKLKHRYAHNLGISHQYKIFNVIEEKVDTIIKLILETQNIEDMVSLHYNILSCYKRLLGQGWMDKSIDQLVLDVRKLCGYTISGQKKVLEAFISEVKGTNILVGVIKRVSELALESCGQFKREIIELEIHYDILSHKRTFFVDVHIDGYNKKITFTNFVLSHIQSSYTKN
ncbi:hypothetical protein ACR6HW_16835 [Fusibacter sp. JL298sf-3]